MSGETPSSVAERARGWHHARHARVCDVIEPWPHGTVVRATRFDDYYDYNLVRVEQDPGMTVSELIDFADEALAGLPHRRIDFDLVAAAEPLRAEFTARGWHAMRLLFMRLEHPPRPAPETAVEACGYDDVHALRVLWHQEDFPGRDPGGYHAAAREIALRQDVELLVVREGGAPVAFAQLERVGACAEITHVYVHPEHRGNGLGTRLTAAAIAAAGPVGDLWIVADDEDRPKDLYARLGFRPAWTSMELTLLPT